MFGGYCVASACRGECGFVGDVFLLVAAKFWSQGSRDCIVLSELRIGELAPAEFWNKRDISTEVALTLPALADGSPVILDAVAVPSTWLPDVASQVAACPAERDSAIVPPRDLVYI